MGVEPEKRKTPTTERTEVSCACFSQVSRTPQRELQLTPLTVTVLLESYTAWPFAVVRHWLSTLRRCDKLCVLLVPFQTPACSTGSSSTSTLRCSCQCACLHPTMLHVLLTGLMFLTRLPCPGWCDHHPAYLMRSMCYFPIIGAVIGAWGAVFYSAAVVLLPASVAAGISTLATVWLTGCFHEDGLSDCFDGFGGGWGRTQILRIMKDSR